MKVVINNHNNSDSNFSSKTLCAEFRNWKNSASRNVPVFSGSKPKINGLEKKFPLISHSLLE